MVRLRDNNDEIKNDDERFQFLYGAIERWKWVKSRFYNNISIPIWCDWEIHKGVVIEFFALFQFLYGAIESDTSVNFVEVLIIFQFLYGAIERSIIVIIKNKLVYFNSYMVRLRVHKV